MSTQLTLDSVSKSYDHHPVLQAVSCVLPAGGRTGIIGENGSGKSTVLRLLAGCERPDEGRLIVQAEGGVGYLAQEAVLPPRWTVRDALDEATADLRAIETRMRQLESAMAADDGGEAGLAEYGTLQAVFELRGGYDADARVERVLHGVGLGGLRRDRPLGALSGGEQARLRLTCVLAAGREVLLLDEPTNHLDDDALSWLEAHLRARRGTTVVVSHDRVFLQRVVDTLVEVDADRHTVTRYGNGYAGYLAQKAAARARQAQAHARWQTDVDRLREAAATTARRVAPHRAATDRNKMAYDRAGGRAQHAVASRVRNTEERLRRLLDHPVPPPPDPLRFTLPPRPARTGATTVLEAIDVAVSGRLARTSLTIKAGERLLVSGPNGAGKSTLMRLLAGDLAPQHGHVARHGAIGYLPQQITVRDPHQTLLAAFAFAQGRAGSSAEQVEVLLSFGLFTADQLTVPVGRLSAGQRQRLALARVLGDPADALLLDEPTNHLSLTLVEELEAALTDYPGALILVSHDRAIRSRWQGAHLTLPPTPRSEDTANDHGHDPSTEETRDTPPGTRDDPRNADSGP